MGLPEESKDSVVTDAARAGRTPRDGIVAALRRAWTAHDVVPENRPTLGGFALAFVAVAMAWGLRVALSPWLADKATFMPFFLAVVCAAWAGGLWPGLISTLLSAAVCALAILPPPDTYRMSGADGVRLTLFVATAVAISLTSGALHRARRQAQAQERALRKAQSDAHAREERFQLLAETIPQLAWTARPDGWIDWFNRRWYEYTGLTEAESIGWGWARAHHPDHREAVLGAWQAAVRRATTREAEMTFPLRKADGSYGMFLTKVMSQVDQDGHVIRWFGTNTDITTIKQFEERLREEDRRKDEFLATLAHELRNPLAPLRSGLEVLKREGSTGSGPAIRAMMDRQLTHMARLLDDLLDVSRISRGRLELRCQPLVLSDVLSVAIETSRPMIDAAHHQLIVEGDADRVRVHADPQRLAQVFSNLLNNAAKYTEPRGQIRIHTALTDSGARVIVQDTGIGISAAALPRVFDLFSQAVPSLERAHGGLGIGLSLVKNIVELHGGTVSARSDGPGCGSAFVVELPAAEMPSQTTPAEPDPDASPEGRRRLRILVADDNRDAAAALALILELGGDEVRVAHDGQEALHEATVFHPQVALLDIGMPRLNGFEAARQLRARQPVDELLLVAVTGWGQEDVRLKATEAGFDAHLVKPVDLAALNGVLARARYPRSALPQSRQGE